MPADNASQNREFLDANHAPPWARPSGGRVLGYGRELVRQQSFVAGQRSVCDVTQVGPRLRAGQLGAFKDGVEETGDLHTPLGLAPIVVFSTDDRAPQRTLGLVVGQGNARVAQEVEQSPP